jgi:hypothetical protein
MDHLDALVTSPIMEILNGCTVHCTPVLADVGKPGPEERGVQIYWQVEPTHSLNP